MQGGGVACVSIGVSLATLGFYSLFRTVVLDLRGVQGWGDGAIYGRIIAGTLGAATAFIVSGAVLLR
jgi:hypothetical protein